MKHELSSIEIIEVSERAQHALLCSLMHGRRWLKNEITFQGGTCLHLIYGAPRFSQDMDFMVASDKGLDAVMHRAAASAMLKFGATPDWIWRVSSRGDGEADQRNPRIYHLTIQAPDWMRAIKIKTEFFVTRQEFMSEYASNSRLTLPLPIPTTMVAKSLRIQTQGLVDTADICELVADKMFAVAARPMVKARDWLDLWWINQSVSGADIAKMSQWVNDGWSLREDIYGQSSNRNIILDQMKNRIKEFECKIDERAKESMQWFAKHPALKEHCHEIIEQACLLVSKIADRLNMTDSDEYKENYVVQMSNLEKNVHTSDQQSGTISSTFGKQIKNCQRMNNSQKSVDCDECASPSGPLNFEQASVRIEDADIDSPKGSVKRLKI